MSLHVQRQMIWPAERALTELALKGPVAGVLALVAGQLVAACKAPAAALPAAQVGLLTSVGPRVSLQTMKGFFKHFKLSLFIYVVPVTLN